MFVYDKKNKAFTPSKETDFKSHKIMERQNLGKWVLEYPSEY